MSAQPVEQLENLAFWSELSARQRELNKRCTTVEVRILELGMLSGPAKLASELTYWTAKRDFLIEMAGKIWILEDRSNRRFGIQYFAQMNNYIDRYYSKEPRADAAVALVGWAAFFVSSRVLELPSSGEGQSAGSQLPSLETIASCAGIGKAELLTNIESLLKVLGPDLAWPNPVSLLHRLHKVKVADIITHMRVEYLLKVATLDIRLVSVAASRVAAAAYYLILKIQGQCWSPQHASISLYTSEELEPLLAVLDESFRTHDIDHTGLYNGYPLSNSLELRESIKHGLEQLRCLTGLAVDISEHARLADTTQDAPLDSVVLAVHGRPSWQARLLRAFTNNVTPMDIAHRAVGRFYDSFRAFVRPRIEFHA